MATSPFVDAETGDIDRGRVIAEAIPLAKLIAMVLVIALIPFALVLASPAPPLGVVFMVLAQFVTAVGASVVLLYVISRAIQLADE